MAAARNQVRIIGGEWRSRMIAFAPRDDLRPTPDPGGRGNGVLALIEDKSVEQSLRKVLDQTMSSSVTEAIVGGQALGLEGKEAGATILFSDIRAFTSLCESLSANALVALLNEYFTFMADVIRGNRGIIDKYIGDAIMALFGVPNPDRRTADNAVQAAIGMIQALDLFNEDRRRAGDAVFQIGIGIANGASPIIEANKCSNNLRGGIGNRKSQALIIGNESFDNVRAGIGIREGDGPITDNLSRFVPHFIEA